VLALGFVLELPWDTGVPSGFVLPAWSEEAVGERPNQAVCDAIGVGAPHTSRRTLAGWAEFKTVTVPVQLPLAASDLAFGHARADIASKRARRQLKRNVQKQIAERAQQRRTVAFVNVVVETIGNDLEDGQAFFRALELLNAWLVSVGVASDMRLGPLTVGDLPESIPYMPTVWHDDGTYERGRSAPMRLRADPATVRTYNEAELARALDMFAVVTARTGLAAFYELVQRAGSSMSSHRYREAVIDYATAGEIFITEMYREIAPRRAVSEDKLANILDGPFADRARHLSRLLGHAIEPTDPHSIVFLWWLHCYQQRNPIVHGGRESIPPLAETARIGLVKMVVDVRESLRATTDLEDLAANVQWAYLVDETSHGKDSWPDGDPRAPWI
jgi:hypothetical protein